MSVVKEYQFGNTKIRIHDDAYKDKTKDDIKKIIERIEMITTKALSKQINERVVE